MNMDALKKEKIKKAAWFEGRKDLKERLSTLDIGDYRKLLTQRNLTYTREDRRQALFERVKNDLENEEVMKNDLLELSDLGVKTVKAIFNGEGVVNVYEYMSIQPIIDLGYFTSISNYRFSYDEETKENVLHILNDPIFEEHRHKYSTMKALELYAAMLYMDIDLDHMYHLWENSIKDTSMDEFFDYHNQLRIYDLIYNQKTKHFTAYDILKNEQQEMAKQIHASSQFGFTPFDPIDLEDFSNYRFPYHNDNYIDLLEYLTVHSDVDVCEIMNHVICLFVLATNDSPVNGLIKVIQEEWDEISDLNKKDCLRLIELCFNTTRHVSCYGEKPIVQLYQQVREGKLLIPKSQIDDQYDEYHEQILEKGLDFVDVGNAYKVVFSDKDPNTLN